MFEINDSVLYIDVPFQLANENRAFWMSPNEDVFVFICQEATMRVINLEMGRE